MSATSPTPPKDLQGANDEHVPWLLRRVWDRLNVKNEHFMGVLVGPEGSGKSQTAIKIGNAVDPSFTTEKRVIFDIVDLLKILKNGEHEPGQVYVLDEAGVQLGNRTWQERGQILVNQVLQIIRDENLGLIFTLPRLGELDSQAQGRLQAFLEITDTLKPHEAGEGQTPHVEAKWKWMDPDRSDETGTIYKKYPRRRISGQMHRITRVAFTPPPEELVEPYEAAKDEFQDRFYEKTIEALTDATDEPDVEDEQSVKEIAMELASDGLAAVVSTHNQTKQPYINKDLIRAEYGLSHADAQGVKSLLERQFDAEQLQEHA